MGNKPLGIALVLSLVVHSLFFIGLPGIGINFGKNPQTHVETVYSPLLSSTGPSPAKSASKGTTQLPVEQMSSPLVQVSRQARQTSAPVVEKFRQATQLPPPVEQSSISVTTMYTEQKPIRFHVQHVSVSHPFVPTSVHESMAYKNYFEVLRDKIQNAVIYPKEWSAGEIYLSFVIKSDGSLKLDAINIIEKGSTNNKFLREAAVQTIIAASPFSPFPKGLDKQEICFNIPIVYKSDWR